MRGHLLAGGQALAHDRDDLAVGDRLLLQLLKGPAVDPQKEQRSAIVPPGLELVFDRCYGG